MRQLCVIALAAVLAVLLCPACARAETKIQASQDVIYLRDGTQVTGTLLMQGAKAVIVLTPDGERTIPAEQVERIVRGIGASEPKRYATTVKDGFIQIVPGAVEEPPESKPASVTPPSSAPIDLSVDVRKPAPTTPSTTEGPAAGGLQLGEKEKELLKQLQQTLEESKGRDLLRELEAAEKK